MKLWGAAMVRNEADVIESFARHNANILDGLAIVDHGSTDATAQILGDLGREGLTIDLIHDATLEHQQSAIMTRLARTVFAKHDADYVFLLDADEFLKLPSRDRLEAELRTLPPQVHVVHESHGYVPDFSRALMGADLLRSTRRVVKPKQEVYKAVVSRHFATSPTLIAEGNHLIVRRVGAESYPRVQHAKLQADLCSIAHVPVRSAEQLSAKIIVGWLACLMRPDCAQGVAYHWREAYARLLAGATLTPELLMQTACNYGLPVAEHLPLSAVELVDDPFLIEFATLHDGVANPGALPLVLRFAERMATRIADDAGLRQPAM
jgi:hypothetical protein